MNYDTAAELLKDKAAYDLGHNTHLQRTVSDWGETIALTLHGNVILRFHHSGDFQVGAAGWPTVITRRRLADHLPHPYSCASINGILHLTYVQDGAARRWPLPAEGYLLVEYAGPKVYLEAPGRGAVEVVGDVAYTPARVRSGWR